MAPAEPTIAETEAFATTMHAGQLDKAGEEYIGHPLRVRATVARTAPMAGVDPTDAQLAALLHDVVEDTAVTLADLADRGYRPVVVAAVDALSKRPGELVEAYLARVAADPVAVVVKHADMADNGDPTRLGRLPALEADRLLRRYAGRRALLDDLVAARAAPAADAGSADQAEAGRQAPANG
jgi:HD domain